jgi:hypothetical protein
MLNNNDEYARIIRLHNLIDNPLTKGQIKAEIVRKNKIRRERNALRREYVKIHPKRGGVWFE